MSGEATHRRLTTAGGAPGDMVAALCEVRTLLDSVLTQQDGRAGHRALITPLRADTAALAAETGRLLARARHRVDVVFTALPWPAPVSPAPPGSGAGEVRVRVLATAEAARSTAAQRWLELLGPAEIRQAPLPPVRTLLVDDATALVECFDAGGDFTVAVRDATIVHSMGVLFDSVWASATPAGPEAPFDALSRRVLHHLRAGNTDEAAARDLAISVRTYRRHVAQLMATLGAKSRFQAGALAARAGLLPAQSSHSP